MTGLCDLVMCPDIPDILKFECFYYFPWGQQFKCLNNAKIDQKALPTINDEFVIYL